MLAAYLDESGHSADSKVIAMGGLLGNGHDWDMLLAKWKDVMDCHGNVVFHMADLESSKGEFRGWTRERRESLLADVFGCLSEFFFLAFGAVVVVEDYKHLPEFLRDGFADPWHLCFQMCAAEAAQTLFVSEADDMKGKIAFFCDRQVEYGGRAKDAFSFLAGNASYGNRLGSISFASKVDVVQLQAADLVAYEARKLVENLIYSPEINIRWPMAQLQKRPFICNYLDLTCQPPPFKQTEFAVYRQSAITIAKTGKIEIRETLGNLLPGTPRDEQGGT